MKAVLSDRAIIAVTGAEARNFLQGLITNDIRKLATNNPLYTALLTPQGKVLFDFLMYECDGAILLDCARATVEAFQKRLTLYRLRAKVEIARRDDLAVVACWNTDAGGDWQDPRVADLGYRTIAGEHDPMEPSPDAYTAHRLDLGVPEGRDFGQDEMFALDADLEELHGVSFDKGCYIGQELTARMKHRGAARKKLLSVETAAAGTLPPPGSRIAAAGSDLGAVTSAYENRGFALLRTDRLTEAGGKTLEAAGVLVRVNRPAWLFA